MRQGEKILLCQKKRGFWEWLWNGPGGKQEPNESIAQAMVREIHEETGLEVQLWDLKEAWILHFYFQKDEKFNQNIYLFEIEKFSNTPQETEEMRPEWFNISDIPYDKMWEDDALWLPRVLNGEYVEYDIIFWIDGNIQSTKCLI